MYLLAKVPFFFFFIIAFIIIITFVTNLSTLWPLSPQRWSYCVSLCSFVPKFAFWFTSDTVYLTFLGCHQAVSLNFQITYNLILFRRDKSVCHTLQSVYSFAFSSWTDNLHCSISVFLFFLERIKRRKSFCLPACNSEQDDVLLLSCPPRGASIQKVVSPSYYVENREWAEHKNKACKHGSVCEEHLTVRCL